jgi:hypothetical protein
MTDHSARIRTRHADPETVAAALAPDDTPSMETRAEGDAVVTEVTRPDTGGLHATVDDYLVNLQVADRLAQSAPERATPDESTRDAPSDDARTAPTETDSESDEPDTRTDDTHDT